MLGMSAIFIRSASILKNWKISIWSNENQWKAMKGSKNQYLPYWCGQGLQSSPYQSFYFPHGDWGQGFRKRKHKKSKFLIPFEDPNVPMMNRAVEYPKNQLKPFQIHKQLINRLKIPDILKYPVNDYLLGFFSCQFFWYWQIFFWCHVVCSWPMIVIPFVSCLWMRRKVHVTFDMLTLDSKPYFYVDYTIPLLKRVSNWYLLDGRLSQSEDNNSEPMRARNSAKAFENQPWALYILKAKSFCFDFRVVLAALDQTNPNPTMIWNNFISLYWNFFEFLIVLFVLDKQFYVLGRTLGFLIPIQNTIRAPPR